MISAILLPVQKYSSCIIYHKTMEENLKEYDYKKSKCLNKQQAKTANATFSLGFDRLLSTISTFKSARVVALDGPFSDDLVQCVIIFVLNFIIHQHDFQALKSFVEMATSSCCDYQVSFGFANQPQLAWFFNLKVMKLPTSNFPAISTDLN